MKGSTFLVGRIQLLLGDMGCAVTGPLAVARNDRRRQNMISIWPQHNDIMHHGTCLFIL
jgi:hypothetical protein